jgi:hypothetical protein
MQNAILGYIQYNIINTVLEKYQTKKLAMNSTALIHASSATLVWLLGSPNMFIYNTAGYCLFDVLYLLKNRKLDTMTGLYLYHHISGIYYMSLDPKIFNWFNAYGSMELSNIPNYFVYYYLKTNPKGTSVMTWKSIQKIWYSIFRLGLGTIITYNELKDPGRFKTLLPVIPLYLFSLIWAGAILRS